MAEAISPVTPTKTGVRCLIHVQPGASRTELAGIYGDAVRLRVAAAPVDGAANAAVIEFLAGRLGIPRSRLRLVAGAASRRKRVEIDGVSLGSARLALGMESA